MYVSPLLMYAFKYLSLIRMHLSRARRHPS
jgi:hypothetical protein